MELNIKNENETDSKVEMVDDPSFEGFLPSGFGKQSRAINVEAQLDRAKRKVKDNEERDEPDRSHKSDEESDDDDDDSDDSDDGPEFPVTHELVIPTHARPVTSATLDSAGSRLITGSSDCTVKLHDIAAMNPTTVRAFKQINPTVTKTPGSHDSHLVQQVLFNPIAPAVFLIVTAQPQIIVADREGDITGTSMKGDKYLRDMHQTKGHTSEVTCADWHPQQRDVFTTAATDSTIRIWDVNKLSRQTAVIVHQSKQVGSAGRSRISAIKYAPSSSPSPFLAAAAYDGVLSTWDSNGPYRRPIAEVSEAHEPQTWTSSLDISSDGRLIITRGGDDALKLWDTRKLTTPLRTTSHPSTASQYSTSTVRFSPSGSQVLVGAPSGHLHILNTATLRPELVTPLSPGNTVISAFWHAKLNQIVATSADGCTRVLFNPQISQGGALTVMTKQPKHRHIDDDPNRVMDLSQGFSEDAIINPTTRKAGGRSSAGLAKGKNTRDPKRPDAPESIPFDRAEPAMSHVREHHPLSRMRDEDPREALLKYADDSGKKIFTKAWAETQPQTMYAEADEDDDEDEEAPKSKRVKQSNR